MAIFVVLWSYLLTTKLRCLQKNNIGHTNAGPNSQQVSDRFKLDWGTYLTTSEDIIYAVIDGRGSGFRGDDLLYEIHRKLGQPEVQDQIDVAKKLVNLYSFIDKSRVAIWGWSYGGELKEVYKTALCK